MTLKVAFPRSGEKTHCLLKQSLLSLMKTQEKLRRCKMWLIASSSEWTPFPVCKQDDNCECGVLVPWYANSQLWRNSLVQSQLLEKKNQFFFKPRQEIINRMTIKDHLFPNFWNSRKSNTKKSVRNRSEISSFMSISFYYLGIVLT